MLFLHLLVTCKLLGGDFLFITASASSFFLIVISLSYLSRPFFNVSLFFFPSGRTRAGRGTTGSIYTKQSKRENQHYRLGRSIYFLTIFLFFFFPLSASIFPLEFLISFNMFLSFVCVLCGLIILQNTVHPSLNLSRFLPSRSRIYFSGLKGDRKNNFHNFFFFFFFSFIFYFSH